MKKLLLLLCIGALVACNAFKSGDELYAIGLDYLKGTNGKEQDVVKATEYFQLAAEKDHASAQFNLGYSYLQGQGVPQNHTQAVHWFRKAAEKQHAFANITLVIVTRKVSVQNKIIVRQLNGIPSQQRRTSPMHK
jgi:TPR repeat protein